VRYLDQFSVLLLDLNGTFMFGEDRFGPTEDFYATYRTVGGRRLSREALNAIMRSTCAGLVRDYETVAKYDDFPSVAEAFRTYGGARDEDVADLETVFAAHEIGFVPAAHAGFLRRVASTHQLGIVSNICARPAPWLAALEAAGLRQLFACTVFSSEGRSIKPSPVLFQRALKTVPQGARTLFAGDSLERDILPAKALGLATAWLAPQGSAHAAADVVVESLIELEDLAA
jgi:FMN phosphatase YigB (HAD superfamily)